MTVKVRLYLGFELKGNNKLGIITPLVPYLLLARFLEYHTTYLS